MSALQGRVEDLEVKLKGVHLVLQEKVQELKEQVGPQASWDIWVQLRGLTLPFPAADKEQQDERTA